MRSQDFIFGTSSQLAADESPDFVRDMQLAIQQSEMHCALPNSSQIGSQVGPSATDARKSCAQYPQHHTALVSQWSRLSGSFGVSALETILAPNWHKNPQCLCP